MMPEEGDLSSSTIAAEGPIARAGVRCSAVVYEAEENNPGRIDYAETGALGGSTKRLLTVIPPYWNLYTTSCKLRWRDKRAGPESVVHGWGRLPQPDALNPDIFSHSSPYFLLDAFAAEFSWKSPEYFLTAIQKGTVTDVQCERAWLAEGKGKRPRGGWGGLPGDSSKGPHFFEVFMQVNWRPCTSDQVLRNGDVIVHNSLVMEVTQQSRP